MALKSWIINIFHKGDNLMLYAKLRANGFSKVMGRYAV